MDAVWPAVATGRAESFLFLDRATDQLSTSSSSRNAWAEASLASLRWAVQQYCWSTSFRHSPIFLPHRKQSMRVFRPNPASPILTASTRTGAILREENLRNARTTETGSKVYH